MRTHRDEGVEEGRPPKFGLEAEGRVEERLAAPRAAVYPVPERGLPLQGTETTGTEEDREGTPTNQTRLTRVRSWRLHSKELSTEGECVQPVTAYTTDNPAH